MGAVLPVLAKAAWVGVAFGVGAELVDTNYGGRFVVLSVITAVAIRALSYFLGMGVAFGAFLGAGIGVITTSDSYGISTMSRAILGGILLGSALGYVGESIIPLGRM